MDLKLLDYVFSKRTKPGDFDMPTQNATYDTIPPP